MIASICTELAVMSFFTGLISSASGIMFLVDPSCCLVCFSPSVRMFYPMLHTIASICTELAVMSCLSCLISSRTMFLVFIPSAVLMRFDLAIDDVDAETSVTTLLKAICVHPAAFFFLSGGFHPGCFDHVTSKLRYLVW